MDRKSFFKRLFGAAAVAVVAPQILAKEEEYGSPWGPELEAKMEKRLAELRESDGMIYDDYDIFVENNPIQKSIIQQQWLNKREWDSHNNYMDQRKITLKRMMKYYKYNK